MALLETVVCEKCGAELYGDEYLYRVGTAWECDECFKEFVEDMGPLAIAEAIGIDVQAADVIMRRESAAWRT